MSKKGLGKGLSALIDDGEDLQTAQKQSSKSENSSPNLLSVSLLQAGPFQPRRVFDEENLRELTDSVKEHGVLQPILVTPMDKNGKHNIIAGERRWRASKLAGIDSIPAIIKDISHKAALEIALIENIQRKDLSIIEEAEGYQRLIQECSYTQEQLADKLGKSRSHITNLLRLLKLPSHIKSLMAEEKLSMGHARALLTAGDDANAIADTVVKKGLSVRQTEALAKKGLHSAEDNNATSSNTPKQKSAPKNAKPKDNDLIQLEAMLSQKLGLHVNITDSDEGGKVEISFSNLEQLDKILQRLSN